MPRGLQQGIHRTCQEVTPAGGPLPRALPENRRSQRVRVHWQSVPPAEAFQAAQGVLQVLFKLPSACR